MLITAFEPFASATCNPSWEAARAVAAEWTGEATVVAVRLPVEFDRATAALHQALDMHQPDVVVALGVAEGRAAITPERIAINVDDARIPDNGGARPVDARVVEGAPDGLFSTLPVKRIVQAVRASGIASELSASAGTFVCNHVFFWLQHALRHADARSGFIHVPASPDMRHDGTGPTMEQSTITAGIRIAVETTLAHTTDVAVSEGTVH